MDQALKNYRKEWDDERGVWRDRPRHDAPSHGADAFRSLAMTYRDINDRGEAGRPARPGWTLARDQAAGRLRPGATFSPAPP